MGTQSECDQTHTEDTAGEWRPFDTARITADRTLEAHGRAKQTVGPIYIVPCSSPPARLGARTQKLQSGTSKQNDPRLGLTFSTKLIPSLTPALPSLSDPIHTLSVLLHTDEHTESIPNSAVTGWHLLNVRFGPLTGGSQPIVQLCN